MPAMRAQASAIYIGVITIVASLGPVIVSEERCVLVNLCFKVQALTTVVI